jgi:hypothetical protein
MKNRSTTTTALGAALALAFTLVGAVAPAFAAEPAASQSPVVQQRTGQPRPGVPAPEPDDGTFFRPDVRVTYLGPAYDHGTHISRFRVENIGAASADVFVDEEVQQHSHDGSVGTLQHVGGKQIQNLGSDQAVEVRVRCVPQPGYVCAGASAEAIVADDLDPSNNRAHS